VRGKDTLFYIKSNNMYTNIWDEHCFKVKNNTMQSTVSMNIDNATLLA
jgi:hypothetical protein